VSLEAFSSRAPFKRTPEVLRRRSKNHLVSYNHMGRKLQIIKCRDMIFAMFAKRELIKLPNLTYQTRSSLLHAAQSILMDVSNQNSHIGPEIEIMCASHAASWNANSVTPRIVAECDTSNRLPAPTIEPHSSSYQPSR
jgi:hypothetical protein